MRTTITWTHVVLQVHQIGFASMHKISHILSAALSEDSHLAAAVHLEEEVAERGMRQPEVVVAAARTQFEEGEAAHKEAGGRRAAQVGIDVAGEAAMGAVCDPSFQVAQSTLTGLPTHLPVQRERQPGSVERGHPMQEERVEQHVWLPSEMVYFLQC